MLGLVLDVLRALVQLNNIDKLLGLLLDN